MAVQSFLVATHKLLDLQVSSVLVGYELQKLLVSDAGTDQPELDLLGYGVEHLLSLIVVLSLLIMHQNTALFPYIEATRIREPLDGGGQFFSGSEKFVTIAPNPEVNLDIIVSDGAIDASLWCLNVKESSISSTLLLARSWLRPTHLLIYSFIV